MEEITLNRKLHSINKQKTCIMEAAEQFLREVAK